MECEMKEVEEVEMVELAQREIMVNFVEEEEEMKQEEG